ncbi:hypothetical protein GX51_04826 [Blastomyces parvus]|uniref:Uncharacterized protein n=1 Tax=Blastomyces parvus TaxID=2060905 RepID=A0A2B7X069_9EURO|nr:hypothetical protein GX51_04826 [Blastomyces parvus]
MSVPQDYHEILTKLLATRGNQVFDIHFLPDGFGDLLHEGNEIGISKKALVQCFIKARQIFFSLTRVQPEPKKFELSRIQRHSTLEASLDDAFQSPPNANTSLNSSHEDSSQSFLLPQTEILLLLDSEHLTACNWRKRRLCALKEKTQSQYPTPASQYLSALHTEISFTTTILRSPLHRHTKSPVLWYHRKWVMMQLLDLYRDDPVAAFGGSYHLLNYVANTDTNAAAAATAAVNQIISYEVSIVLQAGTHHPKNYYAFSYLREFMGLFADALASARCQVLLAGTMTTGLQQPVMVRLGVLARMVLGTVPTWCLTYSHRRDISAWSFLLWLLEVVGEADGDGDEDNGDASTLRKTIVDKTARLGAEVSWDGEGLWIFVDLATRRFGFDVDWLTREPGELDVDGCDATVDDINIPGTAPTLTAGVSTATGNPSLSSHPSKRWRIWIRRMQASQKQNDAMTVVNDNG